MPTPLPCQLRGVVHCIYLPRREIRGHCQHTRDDIFGASACVDQRATHPRYPQHVYLGNRSVRGLHVPQDSRVLAWIWRLITV
jgi:hypothetical protein